jgi:cytochrome c biogenesis protein CcmG, thiol:disulfide interchange protein DsbE
MIGSGGAPAVRPETRPAPKWALALPVLVVVAATATAATLVTLGWPWKSPLVAAGTARVGAPAPGFTSWDLSGSKVSLSDFKGRPVLLTFWATGCTACREELPALQRIQDRYQSTGFKVLAVNYRETNDVWMNEYLAALHVKLQVVIDPKGTIARAYGVFGLPINVLLDRKGTVVKIAIGVVQSAALDAAVALAAGPASSP